MWKQKQILISLKNDLKYNEKEISNDNEDKDKNTEINKINININKNIERRIMKKNILNQII